jgi:CDP-diglyceride synthetase
MATATAPLNRTKSSVLYPHAQWYFLVALGITWLGFSRTYFAVVNTEPLLHHMHGALMGGWIVLLIIQPMLYQRGKIQLHRTLGRWGVYLLMPAIVVCGALMVRRMIQMQNAPSFIIDQLSFLDLASLVVLPALVALSVYYARNLQVHARFIVCTVLLMMPPALTRALFFVPAMKSFQVNVNTSEALVILALLVLIVGDQRRGKIWAPYPLAVVVFAAMAVASNHAKHWAWWHSLSGWIAAGRI